MEKFFAKDIRLVYDPKTERDGVEILIGNKEDKESNHTYSLAGTQWEERKNNNNYTISDL